MPDKITKTCSNCQTKYTVTWDSEEGDLEPLTCPFCGYEVENEDDVEWVNKEEEDDSWN